MRRFAFASVTGLISLSLIAQAAGKNYAQVLVERTLARHPELNALTLHVTPPGGFENIIIASNIAEIGKKADSDDLSVLNTGKPILEVNKAGDRYGVELRMADAAGRMIGVLAVGFVYKRGDDTSRFLGQAQALEAELRKQIPDAAALMKDNAAQ